ncbi:hypothetical protein [Microbacterium sp. CH12i]|uniref:hypothetical protein n=1 Tax=Microbacterium sp. CH12i TaxID=1479651 RepID=UPI000A9367E0|nr:hypothetical protein [Microbacterium sp. CH12i]
MAKMSIKALARQRFMSTLVQVAGALQTQFMADMRSPYAKPSSRCSSEREALKRPGIVGDS